MTSSPLALLCCVVVPVLLALTYVRWAKAIGHDLALWRNGIALAGMVMISADWLFQTILWVIYSLDHESPRLSNEVEMQMHSGIYYGLVALPFAFFLKGSPRFLLIAAWLLLAIFKGHFSSA